MFKINLTTDQLRNLLDAIEIAYGSSEYPEDVAKGKDLAEAFERAGSICHLCNTQGGYYCRTVCERSYHKGE